MTGAIHKECCIANSSARRRRRTLTAIVLACLTIALTATSCDIRRNPQPDMQVLVDSLPPDWTALADGDEVSGLQEVNIDGDEDKEWLFFYRYDNTNEELNNGPIGGIIYDGQRDTNLYDPNTDIPFPFQPLAFFVPYRLLPDWVAGKGQGYLGDQMVSWELTPADPDAGFQPELVVLGTGAGGLSRLSLFRWLGPTEGYGASHFKGSYRVETPGWEPNEGLRIDQVITVDEFYERSKLCQQTTWTRQGAQGVFAASPQTIVFCLGGIPAHPAYPEAVVLAWLLNPEKTNLVKPESLEQVRQAVPGTPQQILTLTYPGAADTTGAGNTTVTEVTVETDVVLDGLSQKLRWRLEQMRPTETEKTARWVITSVQ
jgi:hypothetical protein